MKKMIVFVLYALSLLGCSKHQKKYDEFFARCLTKAQENFYENSGYQGGQYCLIEKTEALLQEREKSGNFSAGDLLLACAADLDYEKLRQDLLQHAYFYSLIDPAYVPYALIKERFSLLGLKEERFENLEWYQDDNVIDTVLDEGFEGFSCWDEKYKDKLSSYKILCGYWIKNNVSLSGALEGKILRFAVWKGYADSVELLLLRKPIVSEDLPYTRCKVDLNSTEYPVREQFEGCNRGTLLMYTLARSNGEGSLDIARSILAAGANPATSYEGASALSYAYTAEAVKLLDDYGATPASHKELVRLLGYPYNRKVDGYIDQWVAHLGLPVDPEESLALFKQAIKRGYVPLLESLMEANRKHLNECFSEEKKRTIGDRIVFDVCFDQGHKIELAKSIALTHMAVDAGMVVTLPPDNIEFLIGRNPLCIETLKEQQKGEKDRERALIQILLEGYPTKGITDKDSYLVLLHAIQECMLCKSIEDLEKNHLQK